ncbi:DUF2789 domain-containing protein [Cupriavidus sp. WKF15]|uniref:DUF2789 domain-containing protein n=1 Tax=Cupriavidus sp. WKF15 TaxID=3032282 RepID=UPI0023E18107|nr:DUF2789 domain-containing protein [Cupriavidus sp. WKF15]WER49823.1 DUF2789 domain-containing protein [Cupriavidus sp. WKF15]
MTKQYPTFVDLFAQLGLPTDEAAIGEFIAAHSPLPRGVELCEASFWTPSQAALLRDEFMDDADWVPVIDQLNLALRSTA